jgi:hypothetical protein
VLRIPHCADSQLTDGREDVSLTRQPCFTPQKYVLVLISVEAESTPRAIVRLEGLGKLKIKCNDVIGNRTRDLPPCRIVPQPSRKENRIRKNSRG